MKKMLPLLLAAALVTTSCNQANTDSKEEVEITAMDSTSEKVEATTAELEEQTKKVEESLEKLDKEFQPEN